MPRAEPFDFQSTLRGDLLDLRPATPQDFDAVFAVASDRAIWALHPAHDRWQAPVFRAFLDGAFADRGGWSSTSPVRSAWRIG